MARPKLEDEKRKKIESTVLLQEMDMSKISKAAKLRSLSFSAFMRAAALDRADEILALAKRVETIYPEFSLD